MKLRASLLCLVLLAFAAAPAAAGFPIDIPGQLYLGWEECQGGGGPDWKFLNCANPVGVDQLYASMTSLGSLDGIIADIGILDVIVGVDPLVMPPFWQFNAGGCNAGGMVFSADFTTAPGGCGDMWAGLASTGGQYGGENSPLPSGNRARVKWSSAVLPADARMMLGGMQTYIEKVVIRRVNVAACPGCPTPACMIYQEEKLSLLDGRTLRVTNPGFAAANAYPQEIGCPGSTPAKSRSWGEIKSLYR